MVLSGKVYNFIFYLLFYFGGELELFRCVGRDGMRLFGEIYLWVNYEGMLSVCLVGIFVIEEEVVVVVVGGGGMEDMD